RRPDVRATGARQAAGGAVVRAADAPPAAAHRRADCDAVGGGHARRRREVVARIAETLVRREAGRAAVRARRRQRHRPRARRVAEVDRQRGDLRPGNRRAVEARAPPKEIRRGPVHIARETHVRSGVARAGTDAVVRRAVADALRTRIRIRTGVDARDQVRRRRRRATLDVGGTGDHAVDLVADAGRHGAGNERQVAAEVVLAGAARPTAIGVGRALGAGVAAEALVVDLARIGIEVEDRTEQSADAAGPARPAGTARHSDGDGAVVDDRGVVALARPPGVEDANRAGIAGELDEARTRARAGAAAGERGTRVGDRLTRRRRAAGGIAFLTDVPRAVTARAAGDRRQ